MKDICDGWHKKNWTLAHYAQHYLGKIGKECEKEKKKNRQHFEHNNYKYRCSKYFIMDLYLIVCINSYYNSD